MRRPTAPESPHDERPPSLTTAMKAHNVAPHWHQPTVAAVWPQWTSPAARGHDFGAGATNGDPAHGLALPVALRFGQHTLMARSVGVSDAEIELLTRPLELGAWSAADRALLEMVDDLYRDDCVSETTWAELVAHFDHHDILEYMAATLFYRMVSGILNSCGVELDEGVPRWPQ